MKKGRGREGRDDHDRSRYRCHVGSGNHKANSCDEKPCGNWWLRTSISWAVGNRACFWSSWAWAVKESRQSCWFRWINLRSCRYCQKKGISPTFSLPRGSKCLTVVNESRTEQRVAFMDVSSFLLRAYKLAPRRGGGLDGVLFFLCG